MKTKWNGAKSKRGLRTNDKTAKWDASQVGWRQSEPVLELIWMTLKWVENRIARRV